MWSAIERFSSQAVQFTLSIIIARLVAPAEYGLIAMTGVFIALATTFIDSGFSNALIQKKESRQIDFSTVFYFNLALSLALYLLVFCLSPYIARFYNEPILEPVTRWVALELIISGVTIVQRAKLIRELDFKTQTKASLASAAIGGGVGIAMAYMGYGVWALVAQTMVRSSLNTILLWVYTAWRPSLEFSIISFKSLFDFGSKLLVSNILHSIYQNLYGLLIGRHYSAADVGYYRNAYGISSLPSMNLSSVITRAIYPVQCQVQDDKPKLTTSFHEYIRISCFVIFPLMATLSVVARPLVSLLLTDKWLPAAELISILSFAYLWTPVMAINNQIINVCGRSDLYLRAEVMKKIIAIAILIITMPLGLNTLCWGVVAYSFVDMVIIIYYARRVITTSYYQQIRAIVPLSLLTAAMALVTHISIEYLFEGAWAELVGGCAVAIVFYTTLSLLFKFKEAREIISIIQSLRNKS